MFINEENNKARVERMQTYKPLKSALAGGLILMLTSGIYISHGFFNWESVDAPWTRGYSSNYTSCSSALWFIGSIIGYLLTVMMVKACTKKQIYITANSVVAFSGFMMACFPESFYIVTLSRFIGGIGHGFAYVTVIQHFGELCEDKVRGKIGTLVHLFIVHGILMSSSSLVKVFLQYDFLMDPNKFLGLHVFLYNIVAAVIVFFFYKESIVTLIESRRDEAAKRIMRIIRSESEDTLEISESFNEMKMMVDEDRKKKPGIFSEGNLKPLIVVTLLRVCYVISYNYSMKYLDIFMTHHIDLGIDYSFITNVISPIGSVIAVYTIEKGRRIHFFLSACGTFLIFIIFGSVQASTTSDNGFFNLFMIIGFKFFSALGLGLLTHIYSAEAFALPKKTASIAFTSIIESFLQIVIIILVNSQIQSSNFDLVLLFASAGLLLPIIIFMFFMLPETKQVSLRVARSKFL